MWRTQWDSSECILDVYHFSVQALATFRLGQRCFGRVIRWGEAYVFVANLDNSDQRALYTMDAYTGEQRRIFSDDLLMGIDSISPDGRYAVLFMASDASEIPPHDEFDLVDFDDPHGYDHLGSPRVVVYDLVNEQPIADMDIGCCEVVWFDDASFLVKSDFSRGLEALNLYTLSESGIEHDRHFLYHSYFFQLSPDQKAVVMRQSPAHLTRTIIYWIDDETFIPITNSSQLDNKYRYDVRIEWISDTLLEVTFSEYPYEQIYTIRIPPSPSHDDQ